MATEAGTKTHENAPLVPASGQPASYLVKSYQHELEASYSRWIGALNIIRNTSQLPPAPSPEKPTTLSDALTKLSVLQGHVDTLRGNLSQIGGTADSLLNSITDVATQGFQLTEILKAKQQEADLQVKVVGAFPPDRLSELMGTVAAVLAGGGATAYGVTHSLNAAYVLWGLAVVAFGVTLVSRAIHQRDWRRLFKDRLESL